MADQTQPWAERTVEVPPQDDGFRRGVASVGQSTGRSVDPGTEPFPVVPHESVEAGWPGMPQSHLPLSHQLRRLRSGGEWSAAAGLFAFVCWGVWAISAQGDFTSPVVAFLFTLLVAAGLFALARLLGRLIWERQFGRVRHTARGSHIVAALFLAGVGFAYLKQTQWIVDAWNWVTGQ